jgi:hypothetical protein
MATLAMLRAQFPEVAGVPDVLVAMYLGAAALEIDTSVWGEFGQVDGPQTKADQGQMYLAMHKLACSPSGQNAKMALNPRGSGYKRSTYGQEFLLLQRGTTSGFRVA